MLKNEWFRHWIIKLPFDLNNQKIDVCKWWSIRKWPLSNSNDDLPDRRTFETNIFQKYNN